MFSYGRISTGIEGQMWILKRVKSRIGRYRDHRGLYGFLSKIMDEDEAGDGLLNIKVLDIYLHSAFFVRIQLCR